MYIPDWRFVRKLKELCSRLTVRWDSRRDRWVIYIRYRSLSKPFNWRNIKFRAVQDKEYIVKVVQNADGSYRPLDNRTIIELRWGDTLNRDRQKIADRFDYDQEMKEQSEKRARMTEKEGEASYYRNQIAGVQQSGWTPEQETSAI